MRIFFAETCLFLFFLLLCYVYLHFRCKFRNSDTATAYNTAMQFSLNGRDTKRHNAVSSFNRQLRSMCRHVHG